ncbi:hypothetical protein COCC4DRAFT_146041 [Bipolaris maydis ATCC 48331]|uniref:Uncharacterized protein n=1 Tax=Cochliobolus heterostrophus (strain C4 / ATCC 48331 / race T) TaxID=665024 RepID=N4WP03_COCH4|nr:uncharacterized protein COCC4DRAFT_146041 [Bipolaris maydis ATCC 48331]ENI02179.1 hypothetical protein COCC4DRAFT_146041 [Bipolaris maydis ATCC 48331]
MSATQSPAFAISQPTKLTHLLTSQHTAHPPLLFLHLPSNRHSVPATTQAKSNEPIQPAITHWRPNKNTLQHPTLRHLSHLQPPSLHPPSFPQEDVTVHDWLGSKARFHAVVLT